MRLNRLFFGLALLITLVSCRKDEDLNPVPGDAKVKRILLYFSLDSDKPAAIVKEFEYDGNWNVTRTSAPMYQDGEIVGNISYDLYTYNTSGQLIKKENYNANVNSPTGFINLINYSYTYSEGGKLIKEVIEYPAIGQSKRITYEYDHNLLTYVRNYNEKNQLESFILYQYDKYDRLITEKSYASIGKLISATDHTYQGQLLIRSDIFYGDTHVREIKRTYDNNNNLMILESRELLDYSSALSYYHKYEYFN